MVMPESFPGLLMRRQIDNREDELLNSRVLFLMTYGTTLNFQDLFDSHQLAESIATVAGSYLCVVYVIAYSR